MPKSFKLVRPRDLPERPDYGVVLHCYGCGADYSATKGDYFLRNPDEAMYCGPTCASPLQLAKRRTAYYEVPE